MRFEFGEFEIDERLCSLRRSGEPVPMQAKVFDFLLYLVRQRDRVVPKQELWSALWPGVSVGDGSLTRAVSLARQALGDDGRSQRAIQTVLRRGYRFVAPVTVHGSPAEAPAPAAAVSPSGPAAAAVAPERLSGPGFVGREGVMARLGAELERALGGEGRCLALSGEAGIGKTRTLEELARYARGRGAAVLHGECHEQEGAPPYWPWVQILRAHLQVRDPFLVREELASAPPELLALVPELGPAATPHPLAEEPATEQSRFLLHQSVAALLRKAAATRPLVLVLEDIHWADAPSLRLLEFVAREIGESPILLAVTFRDDALREGHPLARCLTTLARLAHGSRIPLRGLTREETGLLIHSLAGPSATERLVEAIHARSAGNPLFVRELMLALVADGRLEAVGALPDPEPAVPPVVGEVLRQRLLAVSPECRALLRVAAVIGPDFELRVLAPVSDLERPRVLGLLDEAKRAQLLGNLPRRAAAYRFHHVLLQQVLYQDQDPAERARLHRRIGELLTDLPGLDLDTRVAALAHHFCQAARRGEADPAITYATEAGRRATQLFAFEEAARHFERALEAFELSESSDESLRAELCIEQGRALVRGGCAEEAAAPLGEAAAIARRLESPELLARAALAVGGDAPNVAGIPGWALALLEETRAALGPEQARLRVRILSSLCAHLGAAGQVARAAPLGDEAATLAAGLGDPGLQAIALNARSSLTLDAESPEDRASRAREAVRCAAAAKLEGPAREAQLHLAVSLLQAGDLAGFEAALGDYAHGVREGPPSPVGWHCAVARGMRAALEGRFPAAEAEADAALAIGRRLHRPDAFLYHTILLTQLRFFQGRLAEMEPSLGALAARTPGVAGIRTMLALAQSQTGRLQTAGQELDALAASGFSGVREDAGRLSNLSLLALVCAAVGDTAKAGRLYERLQPFRGRNVCAFLVACNGAVEHFLGLLAATQGNHALAVRELEEAVARNRRMGALPWALESQVALAHLHLRTRGGRDAGRELATDALESARPLGMAALVAEASALVAGPEGPPAEPATPPTAALPRLGAAPRRRRTRLRHASPRHD